MYSMCTGQARLFYRPSKRSIQHMAGRIHALTDEAMVWQATAGSISRNYRALDSCTMA
jgi:hypothetical protein